MLKILKKVAFVALTLMFHVYDVWAAYAPTWGIWASSIYAQCTSCNSYGVASSCDHYCSYKRGTSIYWWGTATVNSAQRYWCFCFSSTNHTSGSCYSGFGTTTTNKCYVGMLQANGTTTGAAYSSFSCVNLSAVTCSQPSWPSSFTGSLLSRSYMSCSTTTGSCYNVTSIATYTCNRGYYDSYGHGQISYPKAQNLNNVFYCSQCPSTYQVPMSSPVYGTTAGYGASAVTACYQPANVGGIKDSTGTYTWTTSCYSCNLSTPTCTVASNCWASGQGSGYTSCNTGGCCSNVCAQWICDPTAGATTTYGVKTQCYNHGLGSCVNNCCTNSCNGGSSAVCGTSGVTYCRTLGYNNNATCTNGCCVGTKCDSTYGSAGNLTGRCTTDANCAADTSQYNYSCDTTTGCCQRATVLDPIIIDEDCLEYNAQGYPCNSSGTIACPNPFDADSDITIQCLLRQNSTTGTCSCTTKVSGDTGSCTHGSCSTNSDCTNVNYPRCSGGCCVIGDQIEVCTTMSCTSLKQCQINGYKTCNSDGCCEGLAFDPILE